MCKNVTLTCHSWRLRCLRRKWTLIWMLISYSQSHNASKCLFPVLVLYSPVKALPNQAFSFPSGRHRYSQSNQDASFYIKCTNQSHWRLTFLQHCHVTSFSLHNIRRDAECLVWQNPVIGKHTIKGLYNVEQTQAEHKCTAHIFFVEI